MKKVLNRYVLTEEIYSLLKEQILSHKLAPGDKINIDQLARQLEVSNIPIREALSRLAAEGLVRNIPFKGMFVMNMSIEDLDQIFEIRIELESLALRKAVDSIVEKELADLQKWMGRWRNASQKDSGERLQLISAMNEGLHGLILKHCGNRMLSDLIEMYIERIQRYLSYIHLEIDAEVITQEWEEHQIVLQALQKKSTEQAVDAMKIHLQNSQKRTRSFFK